MASGVKLLVDISTDKAVEAHNIYGVTKACGEKLILMLNIIIKQIQTLFVYLVMLLEQMVVFSSI